MISVALARRLRDGGLKWTPASGDRFVVVDRDMDADVFTLSELTVEVHDLPSGQVIGFNGTVEWALDSVEAHTSVWLPSEAQLREHLGNTFRRLVRVDDGWRVELEIAGRSAAVDDADAAEAYGLALLHLVTGELGAVTDDMTAVTGEMAAVADEIAPDLVAEVRAQPDSVTHPPDE
jgi:hypothetical protein